MVGVFALIIARNDQHEILLLSGKFHVNLMKKQKIKI